MPEALLPNQTTPLGMALSIGLSGYPVNAVTAASHNYSASSQLLYADLALQILGYLALTNNDRQQHVSILAKRSVRFFLLQGPKPYFSSALLLSK